MSENIPTMALHQAVDYIIGNCHLQLTQPEMGIPYMKGPPGIGKTQFIKQAALSRGFNKVLPFHLSLIPLEDMSGIPQVIEVNDEQVLKYTDSKTVKGTQWTLPEILTKIYKASAENEKVIVLLDDFHIASPGHVALGFELFSERKFKDFKIPENVSFIVAGNDTTKSGDRKMYGAVINRFAIFKVFPDFDYWLNKFAIKQSVNGKITSFLKNQINRKYFLEEENTMEPWASPRSWTRLSYMINELEKFVDNIDMSVIQYLTCAHVGPQAASEFTAYYNIYSKTEMDKVFDGKRAINIPNDNTEMYIYSMAAANEYTNKVIEGVKSKKDSYVDIIIDIIITIAQNNNEIAISLMSTLTSYTVALNNKLHMREIINKLKTKNENVANMITTSLKDIISNL